MFEPKNNRILLPIEMAQFAYRKKLIKSLAIYLYLRFYSDGIVKSDSPLLTQLRNDLKLKSPHTFKKFMAPLLQHNWIGHCQISGVYFVRKMPMLRVVHQFKDRWAVVMVPQDLKNIQVFLAAIIICKEINDQEFYWDVVEKRKLKKAPNKWVGAKHSKASSHSSKRPKYFGLCNKTIARHLGCKQTRACVLKNKAAALGYLEVKHRYHDIMVLDKPDFNIRAMLYEQFPNAKGRIRCWRKWKGDKKYIKLVLQLHDEIISKLTFKRMEKLSAIRLPIEVVRGLHNETLKAA